MNSMSVCSRLLPAHILNGAPLVADGCEGINGLMLSNAMHLSSWLGKKVTLPVDEELFYSLLSERVAKSQKKVSSAGAVLDTEGSY